MPSVLQSVNDTNMKILKCVRNTFVVAILITHYVRESVHRDTFMKATNKMELYRLIYYSCSALYVSGDVFAHHQIHLTVFTASGSIHPSRCRLVSRMS